MAEVIVRRSRLYIGAGIMALLVVGVSGAIAWLNQPAVSRPDRGAVLSANTAQSPRYVVHSSQHFETQVLEGMTSRVVQEMPVGMLERVVLAGRGSGATQLAVTIAPMPVGGLSEVADVMLRLRTPDNYTPYTAGSVAGSLGFTRNDRSEIAVFLPGDSVYAAVVYSSPPDRLAELKSAMMTLVDNWQWRDL